MTRSHMATALM